MKLGGAAITNKKVLETLNQQVLEETAAALAEAIRGGIYCNRRDCKPVASQCCPARCRRRKRAGRQYGCGAWSRVLWSPPGAPGGVRVDGFCTEHRMPQHHFLTGFGCQIPPHTIGSNFCIPLPSLSTPPRPQRGRLRLVASSPRLCAAASSRQGEHCPSPLTSPFVADPAPIALHQGLATQATRACLECPCCR